MTKKFILVGGLPRSGSTLLLNILGQNPDFRVGSTSGLMDTMFGVRNTWDNLIEFKATPNPDAKKRVLRAMMEAYYADSNHPVVFDKCRGWISTGMIEMWEAIFETKAKVLVPVRDLREILSSFEKLHRKNALVQSAQERSNYFQYQTVGGRCETWMRGDQPIGLAINRVNDVLQRNLRDRLQFVQFSRLTLDPAEEMKNVYRFLETEYYQHNFNQVDQLTKEDDVVHGIEGLHTIRPVVTPLVPDYDKILGPIAAKYVGPYPWDRF